MKPSENADLTDGGILPPPSEMSAEELADVREALTIMLAVGVVNLLRKEKFPAKELADDLEPLAEILKWHVAIKEQRSSKSPDDNGVKG